MVASTTVSKWGYVGIMNKPNDINSYTHGEFISDFYKVLELRRLVVKQFLDSKGVTKGDHTYLHITNVATIAELCSILRRKFYGYFWLDWEPSRALKAAMSAMGIGDCQILGAIMYLELDDTLQEYLTRNIKGKNCISEENCFEVAILLGEMEVCAVAIGLGGIRNSWQAEKGKKKSGHEGDLRHDLRKFCQEVGSTSWPKVKAAIKNRGIVNELRESTIDPIRLRDFRFSGSPGDRREERKEDVLHYTKGDNQPGSIKVVNVSKILSKIKKENNL